MDLMGIAPNVWFPVVSVLIGFAGKGVLDYFTDARRAKAEDAARREARADAASLRKITFQRETLTELQFLLEDLGRFAARAVYEDAMAFRESGDWKKNRLSETLNEDLRRTQSRVMILGSRVHDDGLRDRFRGFRNGVASVLMASTQEHAEGSLSKLSDDAIVLHDQIGCLLRTLDEQESGLT